MLEFFNKNKVIDSVERFPEIDEKTTDKLVCFKQSDDMMETEGQCNCCAATMMKRSRRKNSNKIDTL